MDSQTARFYFDSYQSAAGGILAVLLDARTTDKTYRFTGLSVQDVLTSGLVITGEITDIVEKVSKLPGVLHHFE